MLVGVATLPLTPLQSIGFNAFAVAALAVGWQLAASAGFPVPDMSGTVMLAVLGGLCVFLASVSYNRLHAAWQNHREALNASEELRETALRSCTAESALTQVRLAAALSHELNNPLGALKSAVQTVSSAAQRLESAPPERRDRLAQAIDEAAQVASGATARISSVVRRIQRYSNLDGADIQQVDVEAMISDIVALHEGTGGASRVCTSFGGVPRFECPPQALSTAFATLLRKALDATSPNGLVLVKTFESGSSIVTRIDYGQSAAMRVDFQLGFAVNRDRVSAANWDLFSARQAIRALGGDVQAEGESAIRVLLTRR
jgi:signal transduction histidine kinase